MMEDNFELSNPLMSPPSSSASASNMAESIKIS